MRFSGSPKDGRFLQLIYTVALWISGLGLMLAHHFFYMYLNEKNHRFGGGGASSTPTEPEQRQFHRNHYRARCPYRAFYGSRRCFRSAFLGSPSSTKSHNRANRRSRQLRPVALPSLCASSGGDFTFLVPPFLHRFRHDSRRRLHTRIPHCHIQLFGAREVAWFQQFQQSINRSLKILARNWKILRWVFTRQVLLCRRFGLIQQLRAVQAQ